MLSEQKEEEKWKINKEKAILYMQTAQLHSEPLTFTWFKHLYFVT
jgi:hypothetical protein